MADTTRAFLAARAWAILNGATRADAYAYARACALAYARTCYFGSAAVVTYPQLVNPESKPQ